MSLAPAIGFAKLLIAASRKEKFLGGGIMLRVCSAPVAASLTFVPVRSMAWPKPSACWE